MTKIFTKGDILKLVRAPVDKLCQGNVVFTSELYFLSTYRTFAPIQYGCSKLIPLKSDIFDALDGVEWQLIDFQTLFTDSPKISSNKITGFLNFMPGNKVWLCGPALPFDKPAQYTVVSMIIRGYIA